MKGCFFFLVSFLLIASCEKYEEDGSTFRAKQKLTKSWVFISKTLPDGTVLTTQTKFTETFYEDGTMLLTSDYDTAYSESTWIWEFIDGKMSIRSTLGNWDTYILSKIVKLTDDELWIRTNLIDNGEVYGEPDLEKHNAL